MAPLKVLICGAGCAGPALAFWLVRAGHAVTVVERSPDLRTSGAQIDLREQGIDIARRMGLLEKIRARTVDEAGVSLVDERGNVLGALMANKSGQGAQSFTSDYEIMRGDFVQLMYEETADRVEYVFGKSVESHEQSEKSVVARFSDGTTGEFDILVGADGQGSRVRKAILPEDAPDPYRRFGLHASIFYVPRAETDTNVAEALATTGGRMIMRRTHSETQSHVVLFARDDSLELSSVRKAPVEEQKEVWGRMFSDVEGQTSERFVKEMKVSENFYCQEAVQVRIPSWSKGRVVLLGDAACCASPFSGFGLSASLIGSYILAGEICRSPEEPCLAFNKYEETLRPFMEGVQNGASPLWLPKSWWGVGIMRAVIRTVFFLRIPQLLMRFSSGAKDGWVVPDYPELGDVGKKAGSE